MYCLYPSPDASCLVETAEGPVVMSETPNKGFAVLTRLPGGELGFRQLIKLTSRETAPGLPCSRCSRWASRCPSLLPAGSSPIRPRPPGSPARSPRTADATPT